jgi:hypothetical protein
MFAYPAMACLSSLFPQTFALGSPVKDVCECDTLKRPRLTCLRQPKVANSDEITDKYGSSDSFNEEERDSALAG